jgi:hypothetical protein
LVPLQVEASDESRLGAHLAAPDAILDACSAALLWSDLEGLTRSLLLQDDRVVDCHRAALEKRKKAPVILCVNG